MTAQPLRRHLSLAVVGLAVVLTLGACSVAGSGSGAPTSPASNPPQATPRPTQPAKPTPVPSEDPGSDAMPITVDLVTADRHDVRVDIVDHSGRLVGARSGQPGDGISVDSGKVAVENVDDRTLRLTWSDFAMDNALALYIDESGATMILVQPGPVGAVDSIGADRQLVLTFDAPIAAGDLLVSVQDGLDTPGA
jgi:hypothetical protein